jgi:hypothetical protein
MELIMSLYNATVGTATSLVTTTGDVAVNSLDSISVLVSAAHIQAKRVLLSSEISLELDQENAAVNKTARQQDALLSLAQRKILHKRTLAKDPEILAEYNRLAGIEA